MVSIQEQQRDFQSFFIAGTIAGSPSPGWGFFFFQECNSFLCKGGALSFAPCQKWMENTLRMKISLSFHCSLHINVAFHFSERIAIPVHLQSRVFCLWQKKRCPLIQCQKKLSCSLCEVIQSLPPRSIRKLPISKHLLTFQQP